jgi:hypothetical protein
MEITETLPPLLKLFWFVAIPASIIFVIQTIMTFVGGDSGDGINADFDSNLEGNEAPFQLFSMRNLINFLLGFGWSGIAFYKMIENPTILIAISLAVGAAFVFLFFVVILQVQKLAEDNSFKMTDTLQKTGEVYLPIPEQKNGKGRILISVKGSVHELDALTEGDRIEVGKIVIVERIESGNILIVKPL